MNSISKAQTNSWPNGRNPSPEEEVVLFVKPRPERHFEFFHRACFEREHAGQPRMKFTFSQVRDAVAFHALSPICPTCRESVIAHEVTEPHH